MEHSADLRLRVNTYGEGLRCRQQQGLRLEHADFDVITRPQLAVHARQQHDIALTPAFPAR